MTAGGAGGGSDSNNRVLALLETAMPLNVEERFWTATVLPALFAVPNLEPLGPLLKLMRERAGVPESKREYHASQALFFTEFDRRKSNGKDCGLKLSVTTVNATPDIVIVELGEIPTVYGIEAKVAGCVNSIRWQRRQQTRFVLNGLRRDIERATGKQARHPIHVALVPKPRMRAMEAQCIPAMSWSELLDLTQRPDDDYFVECLRLMIDRYEHIAEDRAKLWEGEYTGRQLKWLARRDVQFRPAYVGVGQVSRGTRWRDLIASGAWKREHFQANWSWDSGSPPSANWIRYDEFLRLVGGS